MADDRYDLSEESLKHVAAAASTHRAALERIEQLRDKLGDTEKELKLVQMDLDHSRMQNHDLEKRVKAAEALAGQCVEARLAYETLFTMIHAQLNEFTAPMPPSRAYRAPPPSLESFDKEMNGGKPRA